ncbi:MAG: M23 family metallopeptidase [Anaerolineae bacterium]|nr:M23 family metallopeptidase [Anaerolineae bacterium]
MRRNTKLWGMGLLPASAFVGILFLSLLLPSSPSGVSAETEEDPLPVAEVFSPPLGYRDGLSYAPRITYVSGELMQNTDYGIMNPELEGITCFGIPWQKIYHAGEDLYREDSESTEGAEVTAVADGRVVYANPFTNYPGLVVIIEHRLPSEEKIYSVYSHLDDDSLAVTAGDVVTRGQRLGTVLYMRYTGRYAEHNPSGEDDSHLHFEMRYFYDARNIYTSYPACSGSTPGRGYTYPEHPDDFPTPGAGYTDPSTFIEERAEIVRSLTTGTPTPEES